MDDHLLALMNEMKGVAKLRKKVGWSLTIWLIMGDRFTRSLKKNPFQAKFS